MTFTNAVSGQIPTATFDVAWTSANAGTTTVNLKNITLTSYTDRYELSADSLNGQTLGENKISQKVLTPSLTAVTGKIYDGTAGTTGALITLANAVKGETPTVTFNAVWTSANAGTTTLNVTSITLDTAWATNYSLDTTSLSNVTVTGAKISQRVLTPSLTAVDGKQYDGTTATSGAVITLANPVSGEVPTATAKVVWANKNAGTTILYVSDIALNSAFTTNYKLSVTSLDSVTVSGASITQRTLTPTLSAINSKTYDTKTSATGAVISLTNAVTGESPTATGKAVWTSANAGTTTLNVTDITLGSAWSTNYKLSASVLDSVSVSGAKINQKQVIVNGFEINGKIYDGTTSTSGLKVILYNTITSESPTATATAVWTSANAGTDTFDVSNITLDSQWATNYYLSRTSDTGLFYSGAKISQKVLTPSLTAVNGKQYDGTTSTTGAVIKLANAVTGETPTVTFTAVWIAKDAGTTTLDVTDIALDTAFTTNYILSVTSLDGVTVSGASISQRVLTPSLTAINSKVYDGTTTSSGAKISLANTISGELPTATANVVWTNKNANTTTLNVTDIALGSAWTTNYKLSVTSLNGVTVSGASITKATLTASLNSLTGKIYDGSTIAGGATLSFTGAIGADLPTATFNVAWTSANAGTTTVNVTDIVLASTWTTNYKLTATELKGVSYGTAGITQRVLTPSLTAVDGKQYDGTTDASGAVILLSNPVSGEVPTATAKVVWTGKDAGTTTLNVSDIALDTAFTTNYKLSVTGLSNVTVSGASIGQTTLTPVLSALTSKSFDGTTSATGSIRLDGAVTGETPTATFDIVWTSANAGTKSVNVTNVTLDDPYTNNYKLSVTELNGVTFGTSAIGKFLLTPYVTYLQSKEYDGNRTAVGQIALDGGKSGDAPTATAIYTWTSANAGTTTFDVTDITLDGGWSSNYELATTTLRVEKYENAQINKVVLTPSVGQVFGKVYDGTTKASGTIVLTGAVNGEKPTATAQFNWNEATVGSTSVNVSGITLDGDWSENYRLSVDHLDQVPVKDVNVTKATYDMSKVKFDDLTVVEDGSAKSIFATNLPDGVTATYEGNGKTTAGVYTVTVKFSGDSVNYNEIDEMSATLTINRASVSEKIDPSSDKDDVIITGDDGIDPSLVLVVKVVDDETQRGTIQTDLYNSEKLAKNDKLSLVYDVKLLLGDQLVQPDGNITVKMLIPEELRGAEFKIMHIHGSDVTQMEYTVQGDYALITTDKLFEFVFVYAESSILWLIILLAVILIAEITLALILWKKKNSDGKPTVKTNSILPLLAVTFLPAGQVTAAIILGILVVLGAAADVALYIKTKKK